MVLRRRPPPRKKLCPRCGSPMLESEGVKSCPVCHYSEKSAEKPKAGIKISQEVMFKPMKEDEGPKIKVFYMVQDNMVTTDCLDSDRVCLIADKVQTKIWIWKGKYTSPGEVYRAGTAATRLKTSEKMYSAQTVMIDEGEEPADFPDITGVTAVTTTPEDKELDPEVKKPESEYKETEIPDLVPEIKESEITTVEPELEEKEPKPEKPKKVEFKIAKLGKDKEITTEKVEFDTE